jgi:uncharacterized protein YukE
MALDPPWEVVTFLNFIGIKWPMINEDTVREVAGMIQSFAGDVQNTHQDATNQIYAMADSYQGASYEKLASEWQSRSSTHMTELLDVSRVIVDALQGFADYIVVQKGVAIGELLALAASSIAAQAAAPFSFGLSEVADLGLDELGEQAINLLKQLIQQYIAGKVIQEAFHLLGPAVERAVEGMVFQYADGGAPTGGSGGSGGSGGAGEMMMVDPGGLQVHAQVMTGHAETMLSHAQALTDKLSGVNYT